MKFLYVLIDAEPTLVPLYFGVVETSGDMDPEAITSHRRRHLYLSFSRSFFRVDIDNQFRCVRTLWLRVDRFTQSLDYKFQIKVYGLGKRRR